MAVNLGTIFAQIGLDTSLLKAGVMKANAELSKANKGIGGFVRRNEKAMLGFGVAAVGAVGSIGIASIKMAGDFDQSMRNVNTITKLAEDSFREMKEEVIDLSQEVPLTAKELSEGLFNVASAGVEAADQMNFLATSARAATAGQADLATTVKGITGIIKGYGDEFANADKIADLFFKTNELGVTTFEELAGSMGKVVPIASSLGVTQEELFAATATLTGVTGNTAEVMTQLKAAFTNLVKPSKDAEDTAKRLGISFDATSIQTLGLAGFLEQVQEATGGNVATMGKLFGSVEGLNAVLALTGSSSEKFTSNLVEMSNAAGSATDAFSEQQKGLNNQLKILKNNVSAIALDIGGKIIPALTKFTTNINELDESTKDNIASSVEWGAATLGVTGAISLLFVGGQRLLGLLGPLGKAVAVVVGATTTHFKITEKLSSLINNEWASSVVKSLSLIGSMTNATNTWSLATKFAEDNNRSLISVLFMRRSELESLNEDSIEAIKRTDLFTGSLIEEKLAMQRSSEGLRIRTQNQITANEVILEGAANVDLLGNEINLLEGDANSATEAIRLLSGAILSIPAPTVQAFVPTIITGGISAGQAISTPQTDPVVSPSTVGNIVVDPGSVIRAPQQVGGVFIPGSGGGAAGGGGDKEQVIHLNVTAEVDGEGIFRINERFSNREDFRRIS